MICACLITTPGQNATAGRIKPERNEGRYISSKVLGRKRQLAGMRATVPAYGRKYALIEIRCGKRC